MSQSSQQPAQQAPHQSQQQPPQPPYQASQPQPAPQQPTYYATQYTSRTYTPPVYPPARDYNASPSLASPYPNPIQPPAKRQRLSPNPQSPYSAGSPYNSPGLANITLPNQVFSSPYYGSQANGAPHNNTGSFYNTINSVPPNNAPQDLGSANNAPTQNGPPTTMVTQGGSMGPPSRPNDKPTDMNDLVDVLSGSGVDLREEEAALTRRYTQRTANPAKRSDQNYYSNNFPGGADSFYGAGSFNQPPISLQTAEEQVKAAKEQKAREAADHMQYHLHHPFLQLAPLERKVHQEHVRNQVPYNTSQVLRRQPHVPPQDVYIVGPDNQEILTTLKDQPLLRQDAHIADILALLSLACEERIRVMLEKTAAAAYNRYHGSQHIVPYHLKDLATGDGDPETVPVPEQSGVPDSSKALKRSYASMNNPSPPILDGVHLPTTIRYPNLVLQHLHDSAVREREEHIDMMWARHQREAAKAAKEASEAAAASPSGEGMAAPDVEPTKKGTTKKGEKKQAEMKASEAQQAAATNETMSKALAGKKKPAWMTGGFNKGTSSSITARPGNTSSKKPKTRADIAAITPPVRVWGQFKEKKGMEMRDIIFVLEADGTPSLRVLGRCYLRRNSPGGMAKGWN